MNIRMPGIFGWPPRSGRHKRRAAKKSSPAGRAAFKIDVTRFLTEVLVVAVIFVLLVAGYFFANS